MEDNKLCSICSEINSDDILILLKCGHYFHLHCYKKYEQTMILEMKTFVLCPNCRFENKLLLHDTIVNFELLDILLLHNDDEIISNNNQFIIKYNNEIILSLPYIIKIRHKRNNKYINLYEYTENIDNNLDSTIKNLFEKYSIEQLHDYKCLKYTLEENLKFFYPFTIKCRIKSNYIEFRLKE